MVRDGDQGRVGGWGVEWEGLGYECVECCAVGYEGVVFGGGGDGGGQGEEEEVVGWW